MTEKQTFEDAYDRLEEILEKMNAEQVSLDNALSLYEEADQLIGSCQKRLNEAEQKIEISADNDSSPIVFDLKPNQTGQFHITLDFFQGGNPVGTVSLPIDVVADEIIVTSESSPALSMRFQRQVVPPERMLYIAYEYFQDKPTLTFTLSRKGEVGRVFKPVPLQSDPETYSSRLYEQLTVMRKQADPSADALLKLKRILPPEDIERRIKQFGQNLWKELIPDELKEVYASEQEEWQNHTLLIVSDEPYFPWELVWPYGSDWQDEGFWCETTLLTRWLRRDAQGNGHESPPIWMPLEAFACIAPTDSKLPAAQDQYQYILDMVKTSQLKDLAPSPPSWSNVMDLLEGGGYNWFHAAAHGNFYPESPDTDSAIWLQDNHALTPTNFVGSEIEKYIKDLRPGFVFNACHGARQGWAMTRLGGWANRLISIGAGVFLAPLWTVTDKLALEFTKSLYSNLLEYKTVAEAVRSSHIAKRRIGDPTWLAYSVYSHPNARFTLPTAEILASNKLKS